jgi:hypothetical protein
MTLNKHQFPPAGEHAQPGSKAYKIYNTNYGSKTIYHLHFTTIKIKFKFKQKL